MVASNGVEAQPGIAGQEAYRALTRAVMLAGSMRRVRYPSNVLINYEAKHGGLMPGRHEVGVNMSHPEGLEWAAHAEVKGWKGDDTELEARIIRPGNGNLLQERLADDGLEETDLELWGVPGPERSEEGRAAPIAVVSKSLTPVYAELLHVIGRGLLRANPDPLCGYAATINAHFGTSGRIYGDEHWPSAEQGITFSARSALRQGLGFRFMVNTSMTGRRPSNGRGSEQVLISSIAECSLRQEDRSAPGILSAHATRLERDADGLLLVRYDKMVGENGEAAHRKVSAERVRSGSQAILRMAYTALNHVTQSTLNGRSAQHVSV